MLFRLFDLFTLCRTEIDDVMILNPFRDTGQDIGERNAPWIRHNLANAKFIGSNPFNDDERVCKIIEQSDAAFFVGFSCNGCHFDSSEEITPHSTQK